jgi:hypothetical protein
MEINFWAREQRFCLAKSEIFRNQLCWSAPKQGAIFRKISAICKIEILDLRGNRLRRANLR